MDSKEEKETAKAKPVKPVKPKRGRDKIFENTFDSAEHSAGPITFVRDSAAAHEEAIDEGVDRSINEARIEAIVANCDWAVELIEREDPHKSISKQEMNELFKFISDGIGGGGSVEVFTYMVGAMDLDGSKFHDVLSNSAKTELYSELRRRGFLLRDAGMLP